PEMSYTSCEGVLTRTADWNVVSSTTTGPDAARTTNALSGVRLFNGVIAPFAPTSSAPAHTASALSAAVEFASCTMNHRRLAPETSTSNGAAAIRGAVCPATAPRALIGVTNAAAGGS